MSKLGFRKKAQWLNQFLINLPRGKEKLKPQFVFVCNTKTVVCLGD